MARGERNDRIRARREEKGLTQAALAQAAGISRQSLSAIEAGRVEPAVSIAMRIAAVLDRGVEELFGGEQPANAIEAEIHAKAGSAAQRVALAFIRERWVALPLDGETEHGVARAASGLAVSLGNAKGRAWVELLQPLEAARDTVVLAGCAPALGVLAECLNQKRGPGRFLWLEQSSTVALRALHHGRAHIAGVHLQERASAEPNIGAVRRHVPQSDLLLVTLASWRAGLVLRSGNPLRIRAIDDLERARIRVATRERGAGARSLFEQQLRAAGLNHQRILDGAVEVHRQLDVGRAVALGAADVGFAMEAAALASGLSFIPLAEERFDLVLPREAASDPRVVRLLDAMNGSSFRRELACLGGYDAARCGTTAAEIHRA